MGIRLGGGLIVAAAFAGLALAPQSAVSQPGELVTARNTRLQQTRVEECGKQCQEKVRRLENQVRSLQREVVQLRAEVDRLRKVDVPETQVAEHELPKSCDPPYGIDETGVKRYRAECLEQAALAAKAAECVNPYRERADGVKMIKPECL
jgi:TolA-binding protein